MLPLPFLYSSNLVFLLFVFLPFSFTLFILPFLTYFSLNLPFIHVSQYFPLTYLFSSFATLCSLFCSFRIILFFVTLLIDSYLFFQFLPNIFFLYSCTYLTFTLLMIFHNLFFYPDTSPPTFFLFLSCLLSFFLNLFIFTINIKYSK